jgi:hypothetical protein
VDPAIRDRVSPDELIHQHLLSCRCAVTVATDDTEQRPDCAATTNAILEEVNVARDKNEAINSYITDMLALEDHIEKGGRVQRC